MSSARRPPSRVGSGDGAPSLGKIFENSLRAHPPPRPDANALARQELAERVSGSNYSADDAQRVRGLIDGAAHASTPVEEARSKAMLAVKLLRERGLF